MKPHLVVAFGAALGVSATAVWGVRRLAIVMGLYDRPGVLKIHQRPLPRLGGVGLMFGFLVGIAVGYRHYSTANLWCGMALLLVWLTGLVDDLHSLTPAVRLVFQAAAGVIVYAAGLSPLPDADHGIQVLTTCLIIIVYINAANFLDGSDGLAGGTAAIVAVAFTAMARQDPLLSVAGVALTGACVGFLLFNFPPARIFMGDSGSTVIGFLAATFALRYASWNGGDLRHLATAGLLFSVPLIDFAAAVIRRIWRHESPLAGDRSHYYDLLLRRGWSSKGVAMATYVADVALCIIAVTVNGHA